nr:hypothetical protein Iba_chr04bCG10550 [Ipomoea batatas]
MDVPARWPAKIPFYACPSFRMTFPWTPFPASSFLRVTQGCSMRVPISAHLLRYADEAWRCADKLKACQKALILEIPCYRDYDAYRRDVDAHIALHMDDIVTT